MTDRSRAQIEAARQTTEDWGDAARWKPGEGWCLDNTYLYPPDDDGEAPD